MRREVVIRAIKRIVDDLMSSGIDQMFEEAAERVHGAKSNERGFVSFSAFQKYSVITATYTEAERDIARILGLDPLFSADYWQRLATNPDPTLIFDLRRAIHFAKIELPQLANLFQQDYVAAVRNDGESLPKELRGKTAITFILPEDEREYSSPARLISALEAVANLYSVYCTLEKESESDLIVLACDSGSDKSFDFLGLAKLMEEVRQLVISIWDRRVFHRHMHVSQCILLIAESLPVIEKIEDLKRTGALEPEEAELLKRKAILGATQFLESGIYIDEMDAQGPLSPRQLMRPEPKLLAAPSLASMSTEATGNAPYADPTSSHSSDKSAGLTDNDVAELERLLEKAKRSKRGGASTDNARPPRKRGKAT